MKQDNAFTGLEAAIVLIAFVVVAAVFSYVLLGAGFFATQKAQEVTYAGIQQTTSNMYLIGQVYGNVTEPDNRTLRPNYLETINLKLGVPEGGQPQDASDILFLFSNDTGLPIPLTYKKPSDVVDFVSSPFFTKFDAADVDVWTVTSINGLKVVNNDVRLYPGDRADIEIKIDKGSHKITSTREPESSRSFTLEIRPRIGASYLISKTLSTGFFNGPIY
ncbi:MAG: hypothetical protein FWF19_01120 [Euryarchaeota archaeon]|nr:hypothetical protein [Euryarchaeota archaeon]